MKHKAGKSAKMPKEGKAGSLKIMGGFKAMDHKMGGKKKK